MTRSDYIATLNRRNGMTADEAYADILGEAFGPIFASVQAPQAPIPVDDDDRLPWEGMDDDIAEEDRPLPTVVPLGAYSEDA